MFLIFSGTTQKIHKAKNRNYYSGRHYYNRPRSGQVRFAVGKGGQGLLGDESELGGKAALRVESDAQPWVAAPGLQGLVVHQAGLLCRLCARAVVGCGVVRLGSSGGSGQMKDLQSSWKLLLDI